MEYSLFMIKPCAYEKKDEILEIISKKLNVLFTRDINLDEKFLNKFTNKNNMLELGQPLNKLYKNEENLEFKKINVEQLKSGNACIGVVSGKNAITDLIKICGNKPLGKMCDKETIRYKYGPQKDTVNIENGVFYLNAIHKSDAKDALEEVTFFITEFLQDEIKKSKIKKCTLDEEER